MTGVWFSDELKFSPSRLLPTCRMTECIFSAIGLPAVWYASVPCVREHFSARRDGVTSIIQGWQNKCLVRGCREPKWTLDSDYYCIGVQGLLPDITTRCGRYSSTSPHHMSHTSLNAIPPAARECSCGPPTTRIYIRWISPLGGARVSRQKIRLSRSAEECDRAGLARTVTLLH